ncbi:DUF7344 domain-containing protein [Haloarcula nitratireducens]|uniref:DUF7344 domain-containing protein n=1 Tax=Haloarcula nitratireducens TaxID=2487749 RepID=A0AAW4P7Z2_9EURY|nr:hypothetical protein [Halomicroarcula nitratireducens]MBX0294032.1 hypothetical protein [Halomicroarcula nitratireducens]
MTDNANPQARSKPNAPDEADGSTESADSSGDSAAERVDSTAAPLTDSELFDILKNERRRATLSLLFASDEASVSVSSVSEHVAARENDTTVDSLGEQQRKRVYVSLYQCHLPKMDGLGIVEFDRETGTVALGPNSTVLSGYLDGEANTGRAWYRYYAAVAAMGAVGVLVNQIAGQILAAELLTGGVLLALAACATAHWYQER